MYNAAFYLNLAISLGGKKREEIMIRKMGMF